jgi:hypothetical protein
MSLLGCIRWYLIQNESMNRGRETVAQSVIGSKVEVARRTSRSSDSDLSIRILTSLVHPLHGKSSSSPPRHQRHPVSLSSYRQPRRFLSQHLYLFSIDGSRDGRYCPFQPFAVSSDPLSSSVPLSLPSHSLMTVNFRQPMMGLFSILRSLHRLSSEGEGSTDELR